MKLDKNPGMVRLTRNMKNSGNEPNYHDVTAFLVSTSYWERGNNRTANDTVTWDEVRQALAGISGSLSDAVSAQRQER